MNASLPRSGTIILTGIAVLLPIGLILYQSFLSDPFFVKDVKFSLGAYKYVLSDLEFWQAFGNSLIVGIGTVAIALPLGAVLAFLIVRTDLPGRQLLEPLILLPMIISSIVLALGYVVSIGPVGFYSVWTKELLGFVPWYLYSSFTLVVLVGLTHVPHVYLLTSSALKNLGGDLEEAARVAGGGPMRVALGVSIPMVAPALLYSAVLVFFAGFSMFGLALVIANTGRFELLTVYLFKLGNRLGVPSYQLMAVIAVFFIVVTFPLVMMQRRLLKTSERYVAVRGKSGRERPQRLGRLRWIALALVLLWLFVTVVMPVTGIVLRAFITRWGPNVSLPSVLTLDHFSGLLRQPIYARAIWNSILLGVVGGAFAVACYTAIGLAVHRRSGAWVRFVDYIVLVPNAVPGLLIGLAFLWVFLFFPPLTPFRSTLFSMWFAYTVVWLAYGFRIISSSLLQVGRELEEAARSLGASGGRVIRDVTLPLIRHGLIAGWVLVFMMFESEYSAGVYLLTSGNEVIGALLVGFAEGGALGIVAALSTVNLILVGIGLAIALRLGIRMHD